jgi:hypothetical protein
MAIKFSDVQNMLDAILANSGWAQGQPLPLSPPPHSAFWRQTGDYVRDYTLFTTGNVPNVGIAIMNTIMGKELDSNFYLILINADGLPDQGIEQMPAGPGGPYITDPGYQVNVNGTMMTGQQIKDALAQWLTNGFPK